MNSNPPKQVFLTLRRPNKTPLVQYLAWVIGRSPSPGPSYSMINGCIKKSGEPSEQGGDFRPRADLLTSRNAASSVHYKGNYRLAWGEDIGCTWECAILLCSQSWATGASSPPHFLYQHHFLYCTVHHISSPTPFLILYFTYPWLFCNYLFVLFNPLTSSPSPPQPSPM